MATTTAEPQANTKATDIALPLTRYEAAMLSQALYGLIKQAADVATTTLGVTVDARLYAVQDRLNASVNCVDRQVSR